jgi:hypothetical protein
MTDVKTAVITCIDENYEENLEIDFLETLRNVALYKGKIIVIDYGMSNIRKERIQVKYNVKVYSFKKTMSVFALRNRDIPIVIDKLSDNISNVMIIDSGDVWFQKPITPIFEHTKTKVGCVEETIFFGQHEWTMEGLANLNENLSKSILDVTNWKPIMNAGMVCGPKLIVNNLIKSLYNHIFSAGIEFFGIDQLFFNYELYKMNNNIVKLQHEFNFVIISHKDEFYEINGKIYDKDMNKVTVAHNAGGIDRIINKQYKNILLDESQYIVKNVRLIR